MDLHHKCLQNELNKFDLSSWNANKYGIQKKY